MPVKGRYVNSPECDTLWSEVENLKVPLLFHGTSGGASEDYASNRFRGKPNFRTLNHSASFPMELMLALGAITTGGVLKRFPELRVGFLEGNSGWLPWWLDRLDDLFRASDWLVVACPLLPGTSMTVTARRIALLKSTSS